MNNKIELIYNAVDEIRNIVNAECVPISELPAAVENYTNNEVGGGLTTIFLFSTELAPSIPTANSIDISSGLVNDLNEGWNQPTTISTRDITRETESNAYWISYAVFNAEGNRTTSWTTPFNIKGEPGADGVQGEQGIPGISGEQGAPGEDAKTYRTALAYTSTDTVKTPLTPYGGFWDKDSNSISNIKADDGFVWTTESNSVDDKTYRWISEAVFGEDGFVDKSWSTPFRITGENGADGVNGKDGASIVWKGEFLSREDALIANGEFQNGWAYRDIDAKTSYIFQDGTWYVMNIDGIPGTNGIDGKPIVWKGDLETAPENPEINWCYRDINNGRVYIYCVVNNGDPGWALMVSDGDPGIDGKDGVDGMNVYITYHDNPITEIPIKPEGDGTTNGWHVSSGPECVWMSQKIAKSADEGEWGDPILLRGATGEQGPPGEPGKDGSGSGAPIVYPSGVITKDNYGKFTGDNNRASYGFYEGDKVNVDPGYFIAWGSPNGIPGDQSVAFWNILDEWEWNNLPEINNDNPGYWLKMQNYEAIYSNIGIFNQALVGKWVFAGDYMFSQEGELGYYTANDGLKYTLYFPTGTYNGLKPGEKCTYEAVLDPNIAVGGAGGRWTSTIRAFSLEQKITNGMWIPNVLINAVTGDAWFAKQSLIINSDESVSLNLEGVDSTSNEPSHLKIDLDGIAYQSSENTNKVTFNIGQDGILFSKGDFESNGVEFTLNEEGLSLNQYANGSRSTPIRATPWGCYIGDLSVDNNGLSYDAEDRDFTFGPYGFNTRVGGALMNLMGQGESCIFVNTLMTKLESPYLIGMDVVSKYGTAIRAVGSFDGLCPKTEFVSGTSHTVDPFTYTVVCTGSSNTTITLPEEPDVHKQIEILKINANTLTIKPSGTDKIKCISQSTSGTSASTKATGLLKLIYNADDGIWYTSFTNAS